MQEQLQEQTDEQYEDEDDSDMFGNVDINGNDIERADAPIETVNIESASDSINLNLDLSASINDAIDRLNLKRETVSDFVGVPLCGGASASSGSDNKKVSNMCNRSRRLTLLSLTFQHPSDWRGQSPMVRRGIMLFLPIMMLSTS
jgi:hypothetical protein